MPGPDSPNQAAAYWYAQRLNGDGTMPDNAIMIAKAQRDAMLQREGGGVFPGSWTWLGPGNIGGRTRAIIIHPTTPTTMWLGSSGGGVWKTTDGGTSWGPLDDFLPAIGISCMAIDPANPETLYAGTGEGFFNTGIPGTSNNAFKRGAGVFRTLDGGTTWTQLSSTATPNFYFINRIAICPTNSNLILLATNDGLFRSTDAGASFSQITAVKTYDVRFHPTDGTKLVAGRSDGVALYSLDGGQTFPAATGITGARVELAYAKSSPSTVYAAVSTSGRIYVFKSTNGGQTYTKTTTGTSPVTCYENYNNDLWVDPTLPTRVLVGGVYMFRSTDSGATLSQVFSSMHPDQHVIVEDPSYNGSTNRIVYFGHDGGISRTPDVTGSTFANLNNALGVTQFYGAAVNNISGRIVAGAQDNGSNLYTGAPNNWSYNVLGGDGGFCAADPVDTNIFYAEYQYAGMGRSSNGGVSFGASIAPPENGTTNFNFIPYFLLDPNNVNRMYACGKKIWRTNNVKSSPPTWTMVKDVVTGFTSGPPGGVPTDHFDALDPLNSSTIAVAEGNSDLIYVGYNNGQVWKTTNGTAATPTWTRLDDNLGPLPDRYVSRIVIDRNNTNRIYVAFMGWTADNIWRSVDGGATWQDITGSGASKIPGAPATSFAIHRSKPGWLYAGTDLGLFTSSDDGQTWSVVTDGPGTTPLAELIWRNDTTLLAITHGRGIYSATINIAEEPVGPSAYSFLRGSKTSGGLDELFWSDNAYLTGRPGAVLVATQSPLEIELTAMAPISSCSQFRFVTESSATAANIQQKLALYDYTLPGYVDVDTRIITTTDAVTDVIATGTPSRFIEPTTRAIKAKLSYKATAPVLVYPWNVKLDQAKWVLSP